MTDNIYSRAIKEAMDERNFKYKLGKIGGSPLFIMGMSIRNSSQLVLLMRVASNGDCKIWSYLAHKIDEEYIVPVLKQLNQINCDLRYTKMYIDDENDVCADYDFMLPTTRKAVAEHVFKVIRFATATMDIAIGKINEIIGESNTSPSSVFSEDDSDDESIFFGEDDLFEKDGRGSSGSRFPFESSGDSEEESVSEKIEKLEKFANFLKFLENMTDE